ncbi:MAG TPA: hypothetical protein VFZ37_12460 [Jiangellaceae bacterium]
MRPKPTLSGTLPVLGLSIVLVLSGCGADETGSAGVVADDPLTEFFGEGVIEFPPGGGMSMSFGGSGDFEIPAEELQRMSDVEDLVAQCMADEGFEYTAHAVNPEDYVSPWMEAQQLPPEEFAEQYGYGISTMHYSEIEPDLPPDPNQEYRESLSSEALEEYDRALYGDHTLWDAGDGPPPVEERGCYGIASAEIYGADLREPAEVGADPWTEFERLLNDINSLAQRIHRDPRLEDANQAWLGCMADAGYPDLRQVGQAEQSIHQRMGELEGWDMAAELSDTEISEFQPPEIDPDELAELQEYEIELAVADRKCMAEHYDDVFEEVSHGLQEEFIEEHRAELERYRDWAEENDFDGGFGFGFGEGAD